MAQSGLAAPKPTLDQVKAELAVLNTQAEVAQERLNQTQIDVTTAERSLTAAQARVAASRTRLTAVQTLVGRLAAALYQGGGVDQSLRLFLADNPGQYLDQLTALDRVTARQSDVLRLAAAAKQRVDLDQLAVTQQLAGMRALNRAAAADYADVKAAQASESALLNSLEASQRAALARAQAQARAQAIAAAKALIAQADAAAAAAARARAAAAAAAAAAAHRPPARKHTPAPGSKHRPKAPGTGSTGGGSAGGGSGSIGQRVVAYAMAQVGDAYVWGAAGPSAFDCSGLTMRAYQRVGISLPHSSSAQFNSGRHIAPSALLPGDLVFYYSPIHHVGIYIGGGMIVNAENPGVGVTIAPLYSMPFSGAVRPY